MVANDAKHVWRMSLIATALQSIDAQKCFDFHFSAAKDMF